MNYQICRRRYERRCCWVQVEWQVEAQNLDGENVRHEAAIPSVRVVENRRDNPWLTHQFLEAACENHPKKLTEEEYEADGDIGFCPPRSRLQCGQRSVPKIKTIRSTHQW